MICSFCLKREAVGMTLSCPGALVTYYCRECYDEQHPPPPYPVREDLRERRVLANLGLHEFARQCGIRPNVLSEVEFGRALATPEVEAAYASLSAEDRNR